MPTSLTYPGVYIEEIPSGVRTITGVATSITAFIGRALKGPVNQPVRIQSPSEFSRVFGGLWRESPMSQAVNHFFQHGGADAIVIRVFNHVDPEGELAVAEAAAAEAAADAAEAAATAAAAVAEAAAEEVAAAEAAAAEAAADAAEAAAAVAEAATVPDAANTATITLNVEGGGAALVLEASSPGRWGRALRAQVNHETRDPGNAALFNLLIELLDRPEGRVIDSERHRNLSVTGSDPRFVNTVLAQESSLVRVRTPLSEGARPVVTPLAQPGDPNANPPVPPVPPGEAAEVGEQADGSPILDGQITGDLEDRSGIFALESADLFNLLCIPPLAPETDVAPGTWAAAAAYCQDRRAMLIIDSPAAWTTSQNTAITTAEAGVNSFRGTVGNNDARNAVMYFPRLHMPDPLNENRLGEFAPCGAIAGIMARTDAQRGVWKATAGLEASFSGVPAFTYTLTDGENGRLNQLGLNCLRNFAVAGNVVWGARTLVGADLLASEWKYLPVRRTALFIEESLFRGTQWVVFEPNDEPLWAQIRLNLGAFMNNLFRQGAFQGTTPRQAYFVKCDKETTTQNDINLGIVNIVVGFAPLKPAEFVIIKIQQMAGEIAT